VNEPGRLLPDVGFSVMVWVAFVTEQAFGTVLLMATGALPPAIAIPVVASIAAPARIILRIDFLQSSMGFRHV
jgi:hypothetical protein